MTDDTIHPCPLAPAAQLLLVSGSPDEDEAAEGLLSWATVTADFENGRDMAAPYLALEYTAYAPTEAEARASAVANWNAVFAPPAAAGPASVQTVRDAAPALLAACEKAYPVLAWAAAEWAALPTTRHGRFKTYPLPTEADASAAFDAVESALTAARP